jgi:hypothetical protein
MINDLVNLVLGTALHIQHILKRFDFLDFSSMKLSSLIWCIVGCRIPSDEIFAEKYETKIMRKEIFMDPTLCFIFHFV